MTPLVSICLPNLNTRAFLEERMETLLAQTVTDWELIICDSYSEDGSWEFFQTFREDPRIQLHQVPREGLYAGWNECLQRARGEYIYIATSDDTARPSLLEQLVGALQRHPEIAVAACGHDIIDEQSRIITPPSSPFHVFLGAWAQTPHIRNGKTEFLLHISFCITWMTMTAVLFRRTLLERTGLFRTDRQSSADFEWAMRAALLSDVIYLPDKLATWRKHAAQATRRVYDWRFQQLHLDMIDAVLTDPRIAIPEAWKQIPAWRDEIKALWVVEYLDGFNLYRNVARQTPLQFARNVWDAARRVPRHLLRQILRGFAWSPDCSPDRVAAAKHLIQLFGADWPPRPIGESAVLKA